MLIKQNTKAVFSQIFFKDFTSIHQLNINLVHINSPVKQNTEAVFSQIFVKDFTINDVTLIKTNFSTC